MPRKVWSWNTGGVLFHTKVCVIEGDQTPRVGWVGIVHGCMTSASIPEDRWLFLKLMTASYHTKGRYCVINYL